MISNAGAETYWFCSWVAFSSHHLTVSELEERVIILTVLEAEEVNELVIPTSFLNRMSEEEIQSYEAARLEPEVIPMKGDEYQVLNEPQSPTPSTPLIKFMTSSLLGIGETWVFAIADPDPRPSIPRGHYKDKNNPEPKLNPYLCKAFKIDSGEEKKLRLNKKEMVILWDSPVFQKFCTEHLEDFVSKQSRWRDYFIHLPYEKRSDLNELLKFPRSWRWDKHLHEFWQRYRKRNHH